MNALSPELLRELVQVFHDAARDYQTRVIIITGAGRGFCSGLDLASSRQDSESLRLDHHAYSEDLHDLITNMRKCPQPIIAAVNGPAIGGRFAMALAADIRLASPEARFACAFVFMGGGGSDMGLSYHLARLAGPGNAADLMYSGRTVDAAEATSMGLINQVVVNSDALLPAAREMRTGW